jgi:hypothetical protein
MNNSAASCSRREFLQISTSSIIVTILPALAAGCSTDNKNIDIAARRLIEVLNYPKKAREIGEIYINQTPETKQRTIDNLTRKILTTLDIDPEIITDKNGSSLHERLQKQVRQDFIDENIVIVNGWMLSRTEISLCSLAAMLPIPQQ